MGQNLEAVRRTFAAFERGEPRAALDLMRDDVVFRGALEIDGRKTYDGHDGIMDALAAASQRYVLTQIELREVMELANDRVVATGAVRARAREGTMEDRWFWWVFWFEEGMMSRIEEYLDEQEALRAAGFGD